MIDLILCKTGILALTLMMASSCSVGYNDNAAHEALSANYSFETQALDITTAHNARQLGGYICDEGRKVKDDVLLRSSLLSWLSDEDAQTLADRYNVKYVVDFRTESEIESDPDKKIGDAEIFNFSVFGSDLYSDRIKSMLGELEKLSGVEEDLAFAESGVITDRYERLLLSKYAQEAYANFFDVLLSAKEGEAVIWHCSKGKDRAGLASALLLYALGASDEMVERDYMITNEAYADDIEEARAQAEELGLDEAMTTEFVTSAAGVDEKYLRLAVESVEKEYGSMHNYLNDQLGLSDEEMEQLRDKFLED